MYDNTKEEHHEIGISNFKDWIIETERVYMKWKWN